MESGMGPATRKRTPLRPLSRSNAMASTRISSPLYGAAPEVQ